MKWMKWGLGAAGALLSGAVLTFAVLAVSGTASAEGNGPNASRFQELLAQALGISVDRLKTAETTARNQLADEMAASGQITAAQAEKIKSSDLGAFVHIGVGPRHGRVAMHIYVNAAQVTADVSKITLDIVRQELQQGKSLAQIAGERGVSRDALKAAITAAQKTALQNAVSNNHLTQAQADQMAANLASHLDQMIDRTGGMHAGPMMGPRMR